MESMLPVTSLVREPLNISEILIWWNTSPFLNLLIGPITTVWLIFLTDRS